MSGAFCCDIAGEDNYFHNKNSCCSQNITSFDVGRPFIPFVALESALFPSATLTGSGATTPTTVTVFTTAPTISSLAAPPSSSPSHSVAIGAGVGVPIGVALLAGVVYLFYREQTCRMELERLLRQIPMDFPVGKHYRIPPAAMMANRMPQGHDRHDGSDGELQSSEIFEANEML